MSARELKQAATIERAEWGGEQNTRQWPSSSAIHLAFADWLDEEAARVYAAAEAGTDARIYEPAIRAARLIIGSAL